MSRASGGEFIGREDTLLRVEGHGRRALAGAPRLLLLVGDAGIGKTAFLGRSADLLGGLGFHVLQASGEQSERDVPFAMLSQLMGQEAPVPPGDSSEPFAVGAAVLQTLGRLQDGGGLALLIDDAHTADPQSLNALSFTIRRLRADRVIAVFATRTDAEQHLPSALARIALTGENDRVVLPGLTELDVGTLLAELGVGKLSPRALHHLWAHTGGNPLWVRSLVHELPRDQLVAADLKLPAPASFRQGVEKALNECSTEARALVSAAAVAGTTLPLGVLSRIAGVADAFAALDGAEQCQLLTRRGAPSAVRAAFRHPLVAAAVYDSLPSALRAALHRATAELVEDEAVRLRHMAAATVTPDATLAAEFADFARRKFELGDTASAATAFMTAARCCPGKAERDRLVIQGARAWLTDAQVQEAATALASLSGSGASADRDLVTGWVAQFTGRTDDAVRLLERAWEDAGPSNSWVRATAGRQLTFHYLVRGRAEDCALWAGRTAEVVDAVRERNGALALKAMATAITGRTEEALRDLDWLTRRSLTTDDLEPAAARGVILVWSDRLDDARAQNLDILARGPLGGYQWNISVLANLGELEHRAGNWDDAVAYGERAVEHGRDTDQLLSMATVHALCSRTYSRRGQWAVAEAHLRASARFNTEIPGVGSAIAYTADANVVLAHSRSDWSALLAAAEPLRSSTMDGADHPGIFLWEPMYCEALLRHGDSNAAARRLSDFKRRAAEIGNRSSIARAGRVTGMLHILKGEVRAAEESFDTAIGLSAKAGQPFETALTQLAYGAVLRRVGRRRAAIHRLTAATETFARLTASPFLAQAEQELAGCGQQRQRPRESGRPHLTPQEQSVAVLVASGMSNREVADHLVLSVKTVEFHLGNIFTKLDIRSRSQLAHLLASSAPTVHQLGGASHREAGGTRPLRPSLT